MRADLETGEIHEQFDPTLKWQNKATSMLALGVFDVNTPYKLRHRIRICHRHVICEGTSQQQEVTIRVKGESRPYYGGLMTCGSVWVCPVCAAKIQAVRSFELKAAIETWLEQGGAVYMGTFTVPHTRYDVLQDLLSQYLEAHRVLTSGAPWKRLQNSYGIAGQTKGLEVTWSQANGWHPHTHTLYFTRSKVVDPMAFGDDLFHRWVSAAGRCDFSGLSRDAFSLQDATKAHAYVSKMASERFNYSWGVQDEIVRSHTKMGKGAGFTPFDFLRAYTQTEDGQYLHLFREFAAAFHGRQQLVWSRGFKKALLGSEGLSDEQVAASIGELDTILATITYEQWQYIRRWNMQGIVLHVAALHGMTGVHHLLADIDKKDYDSCHR